MRNLAVAALVVVQAVSVEARAEDVETVVASVDSISDADLGRPYTGTFMPIAGKDGRTLFPNAGPPRKSLVNSWDSGFVEVRDSQTLRANAKAWGLAEGSAGIGTDQRFLVFRVKVVEHTLELDDATEQRGLDAESPTAAYYVRKIHYGRIYQIVISGSKDELNAAISVGLKSLGASANVSTVQSKYKLQVTQKGKGLKPSADAVFAATPEEIKKAYQGGDMGPAVPIMVEYRRIPGTKSEAVQQIDWTQSAAPAQGVAPKVRMVQVEGNNSDWTSTGLRLNPNDVVFGVAQGKVDPGGWGSVVVDADAKTAGGLEMRIGTAVSQAGKAWAGDAGAVGGELKLRVRDGKHTDNKGSYQVLVVVLTESALKRDCSILDPQGNLAPCP